MFRKLHQHGLQWVYSSKQFEDEKSFADFNIPKESSIELRLLSCKRCPDCSNGRRESLRNKKEINLKQYTNFITYSFFILHYI